jgi:para-nitrobenzyl esterase
MVYLHGGAYSGGSANNALYDGVKLCRRGEVVVVTLNHRLNLFGYLYLADLLPELSDSGNAGMLDLVLALEWVHNNIVEFGGDPGRVLIFGQSGGGAKCATLMGMPAARGLFHRVITMSGQQITASKRETAAARTLAVLKALNLEPARANELRTMPMERLMQAAHAAGYYGPVMDGRSLTRDPFAPDAPPLSADIPLILGNTHDETRYLIGTSDSAAFQLTWESLPAKLTQHAQFLGKLDLNEVISLYRRIYPTYSPSDVFFAATTASRSWRGQLIEAERRAAQPAGAASTWVYELDWQTPIDGGKWGAPHTLDIPLVFENTDVADGMSGDGPEARHLARLMSDTLVAFAHTGNPNHEPLPQWRPINMQQRATMSFAAQPRLVDDPRKEERLLIEQVPYTQPGT